MRSDSFFILDPEQVDPARLKKEREEARKFKKTNQWHQKIQKGECFHCGGKFAAKDLTLDHLVPLARGGRSTPGNMVPACWACNQKKKLATPVEQLFADSLES